MKTIEQKEKSVIVELTGAEVMVINNCMNFSINDAVSAIPEWEMHARTGANKDEIEKLFEEINIICEKTQVD